MKQKTTLKESILYTFVIDSDNIKLYDGWTIKSTRDKTLIVMDFITEALKDGYHFLEYRTIKNYVAEWCFHNFLFRLHLFRKHTKDIDFQRQFKHTFRDTVEKIIYKIIEIFI